MREQPSESDSCDHECEPSRSLVATHTCRVDLPRLCAREAAQVPARQGSLRCCAGVAERERGRPSHGGTLKVRAPHLRLKLSHLSIPAHSRGPADICHFILEP